MFRGGASWGRRGVLCFSTSEDSMQFISYTSPSHVEGFSRHAKDQPSPRGAGALMMGWLRGQQHTCNHPSALGRGMCRAARSALPSRTELASAALLASSRGPCGARPWSPLGNAARAEEDQDLTGASGVRSSTPLPNPIESSPEDTQTTPKKHH